MAGEIVPTTAQPDIVRAEQKDELYLEQIVQTCDEVLRSLLGPATALRFSRESRLLATLLYYGLTTGAGLQTLGEEYCDLLQTQGNSQLPTTSRRTLLVLLQSLGPYVAERVASRLSRAEVASGWQDPLEDDSQACSTSEPADPSLPPDRYSRLRHLLATGRGRLQHSLRMHWPQLREAIVFAGRVNLALFYVYGAYYLWSKRLVGVKYHTIRATPGGPSYRVLGLLLFTQLAAVAGLQLYQWGAALVAQQRTAQHGQHTDGMGSAGAWSEDQPARVLQEDDDAVDLTHDLQLHKPSGRQCPLCLAPRSTPTSTPCGHVFCWQCVAQWCSNKPECPLCRSAVTPPQLVPLYHSDY